jgi:acyl carrier protein
MKSRISLIKVIKKIFKKELGINVTLKSKIYDYEQWDSMGNFNILLRCEKYFNIKLSSKEFSKIKSIREILNLVKKKIKLQS